MRYGTMRGRRYEIGPSKYNGHMMFRNYPAVLVEQRNDPFITHVVLERPGHKEGNLRIRLHKGCVTPAFGTGRYAHFDVLLLDREYQTYTTIMNEDNFSIKDIPTGKKMSLREIVDYMNQGSEDYEAIKDDAGAVVDRYRPDYMAPDIEAKMGTAYIPDRHPEKDSGDYGNWG